MTLAENILRLRTAQNLSQGDLAEKLEVSRQSVSKWETGQSVPDLEKIIRLADLFGVSVDELVREDCCSDRPKGEPQIIYVQNRTSVGLRPAQIIGILMAVLACMLILLALIVTPNLLLIAFALVLLSLPLLLAHRHPWMVFGWTFLLLLLLLCNPAWTGIGWPMWPWECVLSLWFLLTGQAGSFSRLLSVLFSLTCTILLLTLLFFTWKLRPKNQKKA